MQYKQVPAVGVLQGVKVLSMANFIAGPYISSLFAEMGATVTSVERAELPDGLRTTVPEWFSCEHRNQLSMAIDIRAEESREIMKRLIQKNDIFIENAKAGSLARLGYSDEFIWKQNPKMVIVHVTGFGQFGDEGYIRRPCLDGIAQAFSGYMNFNGPKETPMVARLYTADYMSALTGAVGALAALHRAQQTGKGESVDVAMYECMLRASGDAVGFGLNCGKEATRSGNRTDRAWGEGVYKCKDGKYVFWMSGQVGATTMATLKMVKMEDVDPRPWPPFSTQPEMGAELERRMKEYCDTHTRQEFLDEALSCGALACPIMSYADMLEDSHYRARGTIIEVEDPLMGQPWKSVRPTPYFVNEPSQIWRGTPVLGMDNDDILEELGFSADAIQQFYEQGVIRKDE
ncbi:MAG: CaiB/BaiF CoA transferase family protein [Oscillospiraceae bacterium]